MSYSYFRRFTAGESLGLYNARTKLPNEVTKMIRHELMSEISSDNEAKHLAAKRMYFALQVKLRDLQDERRALDNAFLTATHESEDAQDTAYKRYYLAKEHVTIQIMRIHREMDELESVMDNFPKVERKRDLYLLN